MILSNGKSKPLEEFSIKIGKTIEYCMCALGAGRGWSEDRDNVLITTITITSAQWKVWIHSFKQAFWAYGELLLSLKIE